MPLTTVVPGKITSVDESLPLTTVKPEVLVSDRLLADAVIA